MKTIKERAKYLVRAGYGAAVQGRDPTSEARERLGHYRRVDQGTQILLRLKYQEIMRRGDPLPSFDDVEFRSYSQNGEDGILLFIFSLIGTTNKRVVEVCAQDGIECNGANLIINHGWRGLLFDGDEATVAVGRDFYARNRDTWVNPPTFVRAWVTRDNINRLISENDFAGEIDLLSIDIDGNDYWVWKAIEAVNPRVVVVEHNSLGGAERSITIPYQEDFVADLTTGPPYYLGATLPAFVKLCREKGYRLVGGERLGFNAFFVRRGIGEDCLPEITAEQCLAGLQILDVREFLASREFVEV
jgi:hypothetical protein